MSEDTSMSANIVAVRDFISNEMNRRREANDEALEAAWDALDSFNQIVRAYRALKQEAV